MNSKLVNDAIKNVLEKIRAMSPQDLANDLANHVEGDVAGLIKDAGIIQGDTNAGYWNIEVTKSTHIGNSPQIYYSNAEVVLERYRMSTSSKISIDMIENIPWAA